MEQIQIQSFGFSELYEWVETPADFLGRFVTFSKETPDKIACVANGEKCSYALLAEMNRKTALDNCNNDALRDVLDKEYQKKSALLQKQNEIYNQYCEENNLKRLEDRIHIAKWDRKQAAAARGAAKRYNNEKMGNV